MDVKMEISNIIDFHLHDLDKVMKLKELLPNVDPNFQDIFGKTLLHKIMYKNIPLLTTFLKLKQIDPNIKDKEGNAPLHSAIKQNKVAEIKLLLEDPRVEKNIQDLNGNSALHLAAIEKNYEIAELLINKGIDINLLNNSHESALHIVIQNNDLVIAKLLLSQESINLNIQDIDKNAPINLAIKHSEDIFNLLVSDRRINWDLFLIHPLLLAIRLKNLELVKKLWEIYKDKTFKNNITPLHVSAEIDNVEIFEYLYNQCPHYLELLDSKDSTPLHKTIYKKNRLIFEFILKKIKNINLVNAQGYSYLHYLVNLDDSKMIFSFLQREDVDLYIKDYNGQSPLYNAINFNRLLSLQFLLQKKYDVSKENDEILELILRKEKVEVTKIFKSLNFHLKCSQNLLDLAVQKNNPKILKIAFLLGFTANCTLEDGKPLLYRLIEEDKQELLDVAVLEPNTDFNVKFNDQSLLHALLISYNKTLFNKVVKFIDVQKILHETDILDKIKEKNIIMHQDLKLFCHERYNINIDEI